MEKASPVCPACDGRNKELLITKDHWKIYRCAHCGLGSLDPRPGEKEMKALYSDQYFLDQYDKGPDPQSPAYQRRLGWEDHRVAFIKSIKPSGRLLDIGCGYGYYIDACRKKGYHVHGLELSSWAARYGIDKLGLDITIGEIGGCDFSADRFDIITMWHFLEHVVDPCFVLEKTRTWLKKDGILVVDVPNYEGTDAQSNLKDWVGWQLPYHLWHFTGPSLAVLMEKQGFQIIKTKNYHSEAVKERLGKLPVIRLFARLIAKLYSGTSLAVIAEKRDG